MSPPTSDEEQRYRVMRLLESGRELSQRDIAREVGISLGKANYCLRALIAQGWVRVVRSKNNQRRLAYMYLLTPQGLRAKVRLATHCLATKTLEYERQKGEIERMRLEIATDVKRRAQERSAAAARRRPRNHPPTIRPPLES